MLENGKDRPAAYYLCISPAPPDSHRSSRGNNTSRAIARRTPVAERLPHRTPFAPGVPNVLTFPWVILRRSEVRKCFKMVGGLVTIMRDRKDLLSRERQVVIVFTHRGLGGVLVGQSYRAILNAELLGQLQAHGTYRPRLQLLSL